jgi:hypothetical protein
MVSEGEIGSMGNTTITTELQQLIEGFITSKCFDEEHK